jgi:hypothetical protein
MPTERPLLSKRARLLVTALAVCAAPLAACETFVEAEDCDPSPANNPVQVFDGGVSDHCAYASAVPGGELLLFNGGFQFALDHRLGCRPANVEAFLSFDTTLLMDGGQLTQSAGNQVAITGWDATSIQVQNDSCADYYLYVTAVADPATCPACQ